MDSSRSGLLSTLLMTLPLIVVPAIALLRPPGPAAGVSTAPLDASENSDDFLDDLGDLGLAPASREKSGEPPAPKSTSEFDGLFEDSEATNNHDKPEVRGGTQKKEKSSTESEDSFSPFDAEDRKPQPRNQPPAAKDSQSNAEKIVERLNKQGALKTFWFAASPASPVGFAAFFRGETELMRIRFEAVGQTREECAQNVLDQVTQWQAAQAIRGQ